MKKNVFSVWLDFTFGVLDLVSYVNFVYLVCQAQYILFS